MFPQKHSFSYSYLCVSVPVGFEGRCGSLVSVDEKDRPCWFNIKAADFLERGGKEDDLSAKLSHYLRTQGVNNADWHRAYLVTAPRFLGYSFNPVSFWYIYSQVDELVMMILEVNNTFDERRMYLLKAQDFVGSPSSEESELENTRNGNSLVAKRFKHAWPKDFHVSPFNSRKGSYSLSAIDPFSEGSPSPGTIDSTITLKSSKNHPKLVARLFSEGRPIDVQSTGRPETARLIFSWWWVGFVTFPRILKEAFVLYTKRRLHVWLRPEVSLSSMGRKSSPDEVALEQFFSGYLKALVDESNPPVQVLFDSCIEGRPASLLQPPGVQAKNSDLPQLELRVISPAFYSRVVHYAHTSEALDRECLFTDEKNRTLWVSRPELLPCLLSSHSSSQVVASPSLGRVDSLRWAVHKKLRCPPASQCYSFADVSGVSRDIRNLPLSALDQFAQTHADASVYRRICAKLFIVERVAFGMTPIMEFLDVLLRATFILTIFQHLAVEKIQGCGRSFFGWLWISLSMFGAF
ncbi:hypothetical protein K402DRAFT_414494 [Aulographum hederae CBS 113979]|uniref:DUF1365-domain-containing protein n=1 Tax=Aulographum hederae CBS 113979 TaxID=1176131 RepID=A0A6G1GQN3_9PEZI|nr:hypothetical protein K402DRAFT_414494 [Aulographum hederae CBS 113979]